MVIVVAGVTGNVGGALVELLAEKGCEVRAVVRGQPELPDGVDGFRGDLNDAATLRDAFAGAEAAFLLSGYDDDGLVAEMRRAAVARAVLLSSGAVPTSDLANAVAAYHIRSEQALRESGLAWTFLRPNTFMTNTLQWAPAIRAGEPLTAPFADVAIATNDPRDVAAVAAEALTSPEHEGAAYRLTGPEALVARERVSILGEVLGRELAFRPQADDDARAELSATMPAEYVDAFFDFFVDGSIDETTVLPTIEQVTGRPPRTFRDWAQAHADAFR